MANKKIKLHKIVSFENDIIFIDGIWGTGKSILGPIVSGMKNVSNVKIEPIFEYAAVFAWLKKISHDAGVWLVKTSADCSHYHNLIGRHINLRWGDDTGFKNIPNKIATIATLFASDGDHKILEINKKNIAFLCMSHLLLLTPSLVKKAFGKRLKIIEIVRHPVFLIDHYVSYYKRFNSPREFTPSIYLNKTKVPWFAIKWGEKFTKANSIEKAVLTINFLLDKVLKIKIKNKSKNLLFLSFEEIVLSTDITCKKISSFLNRDHNKKLKNILRRQKIPRSQLCHGKGHNSYGFNLHDNDELKYYSNLNFIKNNCRTDVQNSFFEIIEAYNKTFPSLVAGFKSK